ncbi:MAG: oligosaccharide flippase family protein, partial [Candidatus Aenigmarchaeota archaeon]|nr:oligosaccharide flippase family protein [Candidatus Aenigmarchaeota archaeon]
MSAFKDFSMTSAYLLLENVLRFFIVVGALAIGFGLAGAMVGTVVVYALLLVAFAAQLFRRHTNVFSSISSPIKGKEIKRFGMWIAGASLIGSVYGSIDQFIVASLLPVEQLGFYRIAAGWAVASVSIIPITAFVINPYLSAARSTNEARRILTYSLKYILIMAFPIAFLLSAMAKPIVTVFYGAEFIGSAASLSILAFTVVPIATINVLQSYYAAVDRPDVITKTTFTITVATIALLVTLTKSAGLVGASIAMLTVRTLEILSYMLLSRTLSRENIMIFAKPLFAALVVYAASGFVKIVTLLDMVVIGTLLAITYTGILFAVGSLTRAEVSMLLGFAGYKRGEAK